jgi:glyoxylase-like metal-dependent hydrolase (beta-lactamase superfamily II)
MKRAVLIAALALAACAGPAAAKPAPHVLQPGHIDLDRGPDGNTVILDTPRGLVVVDSGRHPEHAARIIAHARQVERPVVAVINTHWHLDHTTGNRDILAAFPKAAIVASRAVEGALDGFLARSREGATQELANTKLPAEERARTLRALAAMEDRAALVPRLAIERGGPRKLGGRRIQFHLAPNAATEGDVWLVLPDEKLAIVGDLVVAPFPFFDTGCEQGWAAALGAIDRAKWTTLIPGHGAAMDRAAFGRWRGAFTALLDCAKSDHEAAACAAGWEQNAAGFFSEGERADVRAMANYYVAEVLRAPPEKRMTQCGKT